MLLTNTSSKIRVAITGGVGGVCHASYIDYQSGVAFTPGTINTTLADAATTDVVLSPAASKSRSVKRLFIRNTSASLSLTVTLTHDNGVLAVVVYYVVLAPGSSLNYNDGVFSTLGSVAAYTNGVEIEIDFGSSPVTGASFTITDANVTPTTKILLAPSGNAATGRVGNDYTWDSILFSTVPGTGNFVLDALVNNGGSVVGKRKLFYILA